MRWIKIFEDFTKSKVSLEEIIDCIEKGGNIYAEVIKGYPNNDLKTPLRPVDIDEDGNITIDIEGKLYEVELEKVKRIEY